MNSKSIITRLEAAYDKAISNKKNPKEMSFHMNEKTLEKYVDEVIAASNTYFKKIEEPNNMHGNCTFNGVEIFVTESHRDDKITVKHQASSEDEV